MRIEYTVGQSRNDTALWHRGPAGRKLAFFSLIVPLASGFARSIRLGLPFVLDWFDHGLNQA